MSTARSYLRELATLAHSNDPDVRRHVFRQGLAMLAAISEREPAPLEGISSDDVRMSVRRAIDDGLFDDLTWLSPSAAAAAIYELAQALPPGAERRELGRRVLTRLRFADHATFVRLAISLARTAPKTLNSDANYFRAIHVVASPSNQSMSVAELSLGILAQPLLTRLWVQEPAIGSLIGRHGSARILAHAAREAVSRHRAGDLGGVALLSRPAVRATIAQLLADREALVWRWAAVARGLLAHVDSEFADDIARELTSKNNSELRRGTLSAVAAFELGGAAMRWWDLVVKQAKTQPGIARSAVMGIVGFATVAPAQADDFIMTLLSHSDTPPHELDLCDALAELCRDESTVLLPRSTTEAARRIRNRLQHAIASGNPASRGLCASLLIDLTSADPAAQHGVLPSIATARHDLARGDMAAAHRAAQSAIDELAIAIETLARPALDDLSVEHEVRLLRELDREVLSNVTLSAVLAASHDDVATNAILRGSLHQLEAVLVMRELEDVERPFELRLSQLRALIRLLDSAPNDDDPSNRILAMQQLLLRARDESSSLRRAVYVAMTRAADALIRSGDIELGDVLLVWPQEFPPDEDFAIVREASMLPELEATFSAYVGLQQLTWADATDRPALLQMCSALAALAQAMPTATSPRLDGVRSVISHLASKLRVLCNARCRAEITDATIDALGEIAATLAMRIAGARQRLGLEALELPHGNLEQALRAVGHTLTFIRSASADDTTKAINLSLELEEQIGMTIERANQALPPAIGKALERALLFVAQLPPVLATTSEGSAEADSDAEFDGHFPQWMPLSRRLGGYSVLRPIGSGAAGSVLLAVRSDQSKRADQQTVAVKVPDYDGGAARSMSEAEFEAVFREEASALLSLPAHRHLAGFITFDASAKPKPILVMEYVRGPNLEHVIDSRRLGMARVCTILDGILQGLEIMHGHGLAHLDVKPPNVVLREGRDDAVLVDFGLAGRRLRTGCGSPHYAAREVWIDAAPGQPALSPFAADVYAVACIAGEMMTGVTLVNGESLAEVVGIHMAGHAGRVLVPKLQKAKFADLAQLLTSALDRDASKRPTVQRFRRGLAALAPALISRPWPLVDM
ncbi:MAG: serine/threonine protein kinase [Kofleriaceae bacterium]|nr:serine/threonine protein kinase [Kofleriaceae bacterium]